MITSILKLSVSLSQIDMLLIRIKLAVVLIMSIVVRRDPEVSPSMKIHGADNSGALLALQIVPHGLGLRLRERPLPSVIFSAGVRVGAKLIETPLKPIISA